jgi:CheY-like chemotaxis protein
MGAFFMNGRKRILVIDDEDGIREIIQITLEAIAGWAVTTVSSGQVGVEQAQQEPFDAILLDVMMPDLDGPATFQQLQANPMTQAIPTILLTAKASPDEYQQLMALGVAGVITKPFAAQALVDQIKEILGW